jgi:hypothetical protein
MRETLLRLGDGLCCSVERKASRPMPSSALTRPFEKSIDQRRAQHVRSAPRFIELTSLRKTSVSPIDAANQAFGGKSSL